MFQETGDRANFQGRYVLRHAWTGGDTCPAAEDYRRSLPERHEREAQTLASLTGWKIEEIRKQAWLPAAARGRRVVAADVEVGTEGATVTKDEGRRTKDER